MNDNSIKKIIKDYNNHEKPLGLINNWEKLNLKNYLDWLFTKWLRSDDLKEGDDHTLKNFYKILKRAEFLNKLNF